MDAAQVPFRRLAPVVALILLGLALRVVPLTRDPLHQDEALYGYWGRLVSSGQDAWLATVAVDKPPLALYLIAGSQSAFGVSRWAIRLPGLAASLLSVPLTYVLGRRLYSRHTAGLVAAAVVALTPYPVLFGATALVDPILVLFWLAACVAAVRRAHDAAARGHWGWAGVGLGLAFAAKPQAILLGVLTVGLGMASAAQATGEKWRSASARFSVGLALPLIGVLLWDRIRIVGMGAATGFWGQGVDSYGGLRAIWSSELLPRGQEWARLGGYGLGWPWLGALVWVGLAVHLWRDLARRRRTLSALADVFLLTFAVFYSFLLWLVAFPVWDRYLLPLVPVMGLLLGRWMATRSRLRVVLLCLLAFSGVLAAAGQVPVGGDHGAYDGLKEVTAYLYELPVGTVLYDRWLSWHYDFYLFDAYLYRAGFPTPAWLAADAAAHFDGRPRYVVVPSWESAARLERALADAGLELTAALATQRRDGTKSFTVYVIGKESGDEQ